MNISMQKNKQRHAMDEYIREQKKKKKTGTFISLKFI